MAIVAGGTGGIGRAICKKLAAEGYDLSFSYRSKSNDAKILVEEIESLSVRATCQSVNHADPAEMKEFVDASAEALGAIVAVVYAAGPHLPHKFISGVSPEEWKMIFDADVNGAFNLVWATLPHLRANKGGALVAVITSAVERVPSRDICSAAPKAAIEMLFRGVALEEGRFGIRANCVGPGFIDAGMGHDLIAKPDLEGFIENLRKSLPLKRFGQADEIADAVAFLLSDNAGYITGQSLAVDGGLQL